MQQLKIAVVAANGKEGRLVVEAAVRRGHDVTAVVRGENKTDAQHAIVKDLFDLTAADLAGFDVVVDAFGAWTPDTLPQHSTSLRHLCDILAGTATRLIVVGGAGSLYLDAAHTMQLKDAPTFPEAFVPLATAMGKGARRAAHPLRRQVDLHLPRRRFPGRWRTHRLLCGRRRGAGERRRRHQPHQLRRLRHRSRG
ncbi:hypothetical protein APC1461_1295 [Bifidobacterium longum]|uniref:NAD(P)-binding domain-containing protein n=1 Tax=Bifidobacterium longum TaxID=216816 RepID=A0A2N0TI62_BIFLN|nr:NAD(P)H-binding protein [Bifidobacterium longum]PKD14433.1 hypothetical protein APC1461_1295 [Bifidobacterium longum]